MAQTKKLDPADVVWIPPEVLDRAQGEYREVLEPTDDGARITANYGDRVVWVDENPDDAENGAGHYERYTGADDEYKPIVKAGE